MMMKIIRRGDIFLANFAPSKGNQQAGIRPAVVVQCNAANSRGGGTVVVCPLTSSRRGKTSFHIQLKTSSQNGLKKNSLILCDQIKTLNKGDLIVKLGQLNSKEIDALNSGLKTILDLFELDSFLSS